MKSTCEVCWFWEDGLCHRYPEMVAKLKDDWCGEYQKNQALLDKALAEWYGYPVQELSACNP